MDTIWSDMREYVLDDMKLCSTMVSTVGTLSDIVRRYREKHVRRYRDTHVRRYRDTHVRRYRDTHVRRYR